MWKVRTGLQRKVQTDLSKLCMCSWWAGRKPVLIWNPYSSISTMLSTSWGKLPFSNAFTQAGQQARSEHTCLVTWKHRESTVSVIFTCTWSNATGLCANIPQFLQFYKSLYVLENFPNLYIYCNNMHLFSFQKQPCEFPQNQIMLTKS